MTDWLTPEERAGMRPEKSREEAQKALDTWHNGLGREVARHRRDAHDLIAHAAEADRRLAERDDVIRELADAANAMLDAPRNRCAQSAELMARSLARVDAIGGDHADA